MKFNKKSDSESKKIKPKFKLFLENIMKISLMVSLSYSSMVFGNMPSCLSKVKKTLENENPKQYESVFDNEQQFIEKLKIYTKPFLSVNIIIEGYSVVKDSTQRQFYFDEFLNYCQQLRASTSFNFVCEFIEKNNIYLNNEQRKILFTRAIIYSETAKQELSQEKGIARHITKSYEEGIKWLQKVLELTENNEN